MCHATTPSVRSFADAIQVSVRANKEAFIADGGCAAETAGVERHVTGSDDFEFWLRFDHMERSGICRDVDLSAGHDRRSKVVAATATSAAPTAPATITSVETALTFIALGCGSLSGVISTWQSILEDAFAGPGVHTLDDRTAD